MSYFLTKSRINLGIYKNLFYLVYYSLLNNIEKKYYLERFGFYNKLKNTNQSILLFSNAGGELAGAELFIQKLKDAFPEKKIIVTVENYDAMKIVKNSVRTADDYLYFPYDLFSSTKKFIKKTNPFLVFFFGNIFRTELINQCYNSGIKTGIVNGYFRKNLLIKKGALRCISKMIYENSFDKLSFLLMQTKEDAEEISKYLKDKSKVHITGFVKSDFSYGFVSDKEKKKLLFDYNLKKTDVVLIAGATNHDEETILNAYQKIKEQVKQVKLIIVPRHSYRIKEVENLLALKDLKFKRKSELFAPSEIILVDTDINLSKLYSIGTINILGRSFVPFEKVAQGGSNIFEAAIHGKPILFGTNMSSWKEHSTKVLNEFPELEAKDSKDLADKILKLVKNKEYYSKVSAFVKKFADKELREKETVADKNIKLIKKLTKI